MIHEKEQWILLLSSVFIALIGIFLSNFIFTEKKTEVEELDKDYYLNQVSEDENGMTEKWAEDLIKYNGKDYIYDTNLKTYLFLGIDKDGIVEKASNYQDGGQSDAMFLLVTNPLSKELKIVSINRNTMTEVQMFDKDGGSLGKHQAQICVQHGYGDGKKYSCNLTLEAVKNLFYQIPINGYFALNVGGVKQLTDFVGGVEIVVLPGLENSEEFKFETGEKVNLDGVQAYYYLRRRDTNQLGSADLRLARQQQYIEAYLPKLLDRINNDPETALDLYKAIEDFVETDMNADTVLNQLAQYNFETKEMYIVPGETKLGDSGFEEYYVDEIGLYELILNVFYKEYGS